MKRLKTNKGITLIALVITIIVLLILAAVSIATLTGENGILNQATKAKTETAHKEVYEALSLKVSEYTLEKNTGEYTGTLTEYLTKEGYISQMEGIEGYIINVVKLVGTKTTFGNGTDGRTDVYKLEEDDSGAQTTKIASTDIVKIAETNGSKKYKVIYYGKTENENRDLGIINDTVEESKPKEMISFTVYHAGGYSTHNTDYCIVRYQCEEGMTWRQFVKSKYNAREYIELVEDTDNYFEKWKPFKLDEYGKVLGQYSGPEFYRDAGESDDMTDEKIEALKQYEDICPAECVYPSSNILVSKEGKTIEAKDIKEGNDIAYYDFDAEEVKIGKVEKTYIHKDATKFVRYKFEDGSYLEATDYHPIYTKQGWKSYTRRNGYEMPEVGDEVKTEKGWKKLIEIESFEGKEDCYDFVVKGEDGKKVNNYYANGTLVQGSY